MEPNNYQQQPAPRSKGRPILIGCLATFAVLIVACGIGSYWAYSNARTIGGNFFRTTFTDMANQSDLPDDQKQEMVVQIDRLADGFIAGDVGMEELAQVQQHLENSPLIHYMGIWVMRDGYIQPSGLSAEEKAHAELQLERYARGIFEKQIDQATLETATQPISTRDADGSWELKEQSQVSDDELRTFIATIEQHADDASISHERFEINVAAEFRDLVDKVLGETSVEPAEPVEVEAAAVAQ